MLAVAILKEVAKKQDLLCIFLEIVQYQYQYSVKHI